SFRNIDKNLINDENSYIDPITGSEHPSFYDFIHKNDLIYTDIPGSINPPHTGVTSGYTFYNTTIYIDPDPDREDVKVDPKTEIVTEPKPETPSVEQQVADIERRRQEDINKNIIAPIFPETQIKTVLYHN